MYELSNYEKSFDFYCCENYLLFILTLCLCKNVFCAIREKRKYKKSEQMKIRQATPVDNEKLLELSRETPMLGSLVINVDRSPDYFCLARLQGENCKIFIAEKNDEILGMIGCSFREITLFGKLTPIAYIGGIKIRESAKSGLTVFRLMKKMKDYLLESKIKFAVILILNDNKAMTNLLSGRAGIPAFHLLAKYHITYIIPLYSLKSTGNYTIRESKPSDLEEIVNLFSQFYKDVELSPKWTPGFFTRLLEQSPNYNYSSILIALKNGNIVAALSLWDQSSFKQTVIERYSRWFKGLRFLTTPLHLLPRVGEPLSEICLRHAVYAEGYEPAVKDLVRAAIKKHRKEYRFFRAGFQDGDPLNNSTKGFPKMKIGLNLYAGFREDCTDTNDIIDRLSQLKIWEDLSLH